MASRPASKPVKNVLGFTQLETGLSYVPVSVGIGFGSTLATKMFLTAVRSMLEHE